MVSSMDVASIKNLKVSLIKTPGKNEFPENKIITIMNRAYSKVGIDLNEIESAISLKLMFLFPAA